MKVRVMAVVSTVTKGFSSHIFVLAIDICFTSFVSEASQASSARSHISDMRAHVSIDRVSKVSIDRAS